MSLLQKFQDHTRLQNLFAAKDKLLLAVSGGVDSVVLCELCRQAGYDFVIAHCNFKLRGKESERDKEFVMALAKKYHVEFLTRDFETEQYAAEKKISTQEAARKLRYDWFKELIDNRQYTIDKGSTRIEDPNCPLPIANWLLTAHHADDNIETLMMNFFRGTGLHGLTGIPEKTGYIRRPLLSFSKDELLGFAKENKLEFVEDSSNQSSKYTRNFFRNELIPAISKVYPQVKENLQNNINRFKDIERLYEHSVGEIKKKLCKKKGNETHIPVKQLMQYDNRALIYAIISAYGFSEKQIDEVIKLAGSDSGKYISSPDGQYRFIRHRHWFIISPVISVESGYIIIEKSMGNVQYAMGNLELKELSVASCQLPIANFTACLDLKEISFPLLLRKWKTGDYFYPLGMKKKKKVARFLMDLKLSRSDKEKVWVIESNKRIAWVMGHRIDDRFKVTDKTTNVQQLTLKP